MLVIKNKPSTKTPAHLQMRNLIFQPSQVLLLRLDLLQGHLLLSRDPYHQVVFLHFEEAFELVALVTQHDQGVVGPLHRLESRAPSAIVKPPPEKDRREKKVRAEQEQV